MRIPRSRGAVSGVLLVLLGLWGGLIAFAGPSFDFGFRPDDAWHMTEGRFYLSVLPAGATVVGGLVLLRSANRIVAALGGWIALAGGVWFAVGTQVSRLWNDGEPQVGDPIDGGGGTLEQLAFFSGLGAAIGILAAFALGRLAVKGVRDAELDAGEDGVERGDDRIEAGGDPPAARDGRTRVRLRREHKPEPVAAEDDADTTRVARRTEAEADGEAGRTRVASRPKPDGDQKS